MILIVEDCAPVATVLMRHLASAGYRSIVVGDARAALEQLAHEVPECIMLDLMLPGVNGSALLHHVRQTPATASVPVVLVSAQIGAGKTHLGTQIEADCSIGKPFTRNQVIDAVRAAVRKRADLSPS
jgi:DNA-binding response OmpR family regulator